MKEFDPNAVIETKRLRLRFLKVEDTHDIFVNVNHDRDVLLYFIDKYKEEEEEMDLNRTISYCLENKRYLFAIELKLTGRVIGMILQCSTANAVFNTSEVGYAIGKRFWNQGYATEALSAMIDFLFSIGVHKVVASYMSQNLASRRVMEKCGMLYEGHRKDEVFYHDTYMDTDHFYIINPED